MIVSCTAEFIRNPLQSLHHKAPVLVFRQFLQAHPSTSRISLWHLMRHEHTLPPTPTSRNPTPLTFSCVACSSHGQQGSLHSGSSVRMGCSSGVPGLEHPHLAQHCQVGRGEQALNKQSPTMQHDGTHGGQTVQSAQWSGR